MIIYPAIDLINAKAVRLERGDYSKKTEYSDDPTALAREFEAAGARYIHIVDLDGAKAKRPINTDIIKDIAAAVKIPIQVGGGIRSLEAAGQLLEYAKRVIVGTAAITDPEVLRSMLEKFGADRVAVSVDYKNDLPAINGWLEEADLSTDVLQARLNGFGTRVVIVTDTQKDGLMGGPNIELIRQWKNAGFEVICAGGVASVSDIKSLAEVGADGAIIGKALYEGKIRLKEALDAS